MANQNTFDFPNWDKITEKTAALLYAESEKRLQETVNTFNLHTDKAFRLLSLLLPSVTLVAGFVVYSTPLQQTGANWPAIVFVLLNIASIFILIRVISVRTIQIPGSLPQDLFVEKLIHDDKDGSQYVGWAVTLSEKIQDKIKHNTPINESRVKLIQYALWLSGIVAPLSSFIVFLSSH